MDATSISETPTTLIGSVGSPAPGWDELLEWIPEWAHRILHVGCGVGQLARAIRSRQVAEVSGIERDAARAALADQFLDRLIVGDVEQLPHDLPPASFDCVVCSILSRLKDPWRVLSRLRGWLTPEGRLFLRFPNLRDHRAIAALMEGVWHEPSVPALEDSNLRFFTRREAEKMLFRAGFEIVRTRALPGVGYQEWLDHGRQSEVRIGRLCISRLPPRQTEEFYASHYLLDATPRVSSPGLTSIIILTHNQLQYTRLCVDSILRYTDEPYELIFVDNASSDGTAEYLSSITGAKVITNAENRGFPAGVNQGIRVAEGRQILLVNNDCVVTTGWLDRLLRALRSDLAVGLVGPSSNSVSGPQQVSVPYEELSRVDGFAWDFCRTNDGHYEATDRLVGFCMLVKREVIDKIGLFDERFGVGCYEDDDYCRRARRAGYRLLIVRDSFVHHFGSRTFLASGAGLLGQALQENGELFREKWAGDETQGPPAPAFRPQRSAPPVGWQLDSSRADGLLLKPRNVVLSLCMIVRDNARTIGACLDSVKPWVDEIVVVDTGSKDNTPELVRQRGARLFQFSWCDDFSAARNDSLAYACGKWLFWMDSDDTIDAANGRKLRELALSASDPSVLGYVMQVHCPGDGEEGAADVTVVDHVKLIRNRPDLRFEHRIHEQILPAIRRAGGEVAFTDIFVVHSGADHTPEGRERKLRRDFRLLDLDLKERADHPFVLFNLGMTYADAGQQEKAVASLRRSIEVADPTESHVRKAYALLIGSYCQLDRYDDAWQALEEARRHYPDDAELLFREGVLHHHFKRLAEAEGAYLRVLQPPKERHFASVDCGIAGFKARHNLALVYEDMGNLPAAEEQWRKVVAEAPAYRPGWRGLGEVLLHQRELDAADELARQLLADNSLSERVHVEATILQARLAEAQGDLTEARRLFEAAVSRFPEDLDSRNALCRFLFERGEPAEAKHSLEQLLQLAPDDAAAYHNLGATHLRMGRTKEAAEALHASLRCRPDSPATEMLLAQALNSGGGSVEAATAP